MAGPRIKGRRVDGNEKHMPGDFGLIDGIWYAKPPGMPNHGIANLSNHTVVEHEDKSITVSPSIEVTASDGHGDPVVWHGMLERGIWSKL